MLLTQQNAAQYVGKKVDCYHRSFHYYPLEIIEQDNVYSVIDRVGTRFRIPDEKDYFSAIPFNFSYPADGKEVTPEEAKFRALDCAPYYDF